MSIEKVKAYFASVGLADRILEFEIEHYDELGDKVVKSGRTTTVCRVDVTDDLGKDIAVFLGTGFKQPREVLA